MRLRRRIWTIGPTQQRARQQLRPVTGGQASPGGTPGQMPLALVSVYPSPAAEYATVAYHGLQPIFTADGAAIPATSPGRWAQLAAAGNPRDGAQRRGAGRAARWIGGGA